MKLTAENVNKVFLFCSLSEYDGHGESKEVNGVMLSVWFSKTRLEQSKQDIVDMLNCLPDNFKKSGGGGWSFLNMCQDNNDEQWTGFHSDIDKLVTLGIATDSVSFLMPKDMWDVLPGGMPYILIEKQWN